MERKILLITPFYPPAIGGVETSLYTLVTLLTRKGYKMKVIHINVNPWIFNKLEPYKWLQFLHLFPFLFLKSLIYMMLHKKRVSVLHGAGSVGGFCAFLLYIIFGKNYFTN